MTQVEEHFPKVSARKEKCNPFNFAQKNRRIEKLTLYKVPICRASLDEAMCTLDFKIQNPNQILEHF